MPIIARFLGVVVRMFFNDHNPPHLHAEAQQQEGIYALRDGQRLEGELKTKDEKNVQAWMARRRPELLANWERARQGQPLDQVEE